MLDVVELPGHLDLMLLATVQRLGQGHGYALVTAIRNASDGAFDLAEGTVYPALHRLERGGALVSRREPAARAGTAGAGAGAKTGTVRPRRVYRLTAAGEAMLADRRRRWSEAAAAMNKVVGPAPSA
jgi:DNA-binding PadR family transcriptional regulator